jgi:hypothetical protein
MLSTYEGLGVGSLLNFPLLGDCRISSGMVGLMFGLRGQLTGGATCLAV